MKLLSAIATLALSIGASAKVDKAKVCETLYTSLNADKTLNILVAYGYKDARPHRFVGDRHERLVLVQKILSPCDESEEFLCGFQRREDDGERFFRKISGSEGQKSYVNLDILAASRGPDDQMNRDSVFQTHSSQFVRRRFLKALEAYEVVFYNGHSRAGGGPDFFPPKLQRDKSVDYGYYQSKQPGFNEILDNLKSTSPTKIFGLFSCASSKYFRKKILTIKEDLSFISSPNLLYHIDANTNMFAALRGVLAGECEATINEGMRSKTPRIGSELEMRGPEVFRPPAQVEPATIFDETLSGDLEAELKDELEDAL